MQNEIAKGFTDLAKPGRDLPFCGGDCRLTGNASLPNFLEMSRPYFPKTSNFKAVVVAEAGHGLNLVRPFPFHF